MFWGERKDICTFVILFLKIFIIYFQTNHELELNDNYVGIKLPVEIL